jgi:hypothetical protein
LFEEATDVAKIVFKHFSAGETDIIENKYFTKELKDVFYFSDFFKKDF